MIDRTPAFRRFADDLIALSELAAALGMTEDEAQAAFDEWQARPVSKRDRAADGPTFAALFDGVTPGENTTENRA